METNDFTLIFDGFWQQNKMDCLPDTFGVYCVYAFFSESDEEDGGIRRLLYVGSAHSIRREVMQHPCWPSWLMELKGRERVCLTAAILPSSSHRTRLEAALIFHHQPPVCDEKNGIYLESFPFDETTLTLKGAANLLSPMFSIPANGIKNVGGTTLRVVDKPGPSKSKRVA